MTNPVLVALTISSNLTIGAGGAIIIDGAGYPSGQGQGSGRYASSPTTGGGGGGYGGMGAIGLGGTAGRELPTVI